MSSSFGKFDSTASFYATRTSKLGKNEIHIYPLQQNKTKLTSSSSLSSSFEIDSESELVSFDWIQQAGVSKSKRSKRRHSMNGSSHENSSTPSYLAVSFKSGKILVYSPFKKEVINEFQTDIQISALASSSNSFWVASGHEVHEYALNDSKPKNQVSLPKSIKEVTSLKHITLDGEEILLAGGNKLVTYNVTQNKLLKEFTAAKGKTSSINSIIYTNKHIITSRGKPSTIQVYSLDNKKEVNSLKTTKHIVSLAEIDGDSIATLNGDGIVDIYNDITSSSSVSYSINSNFSEIGFAGVVSNDKNIYLSWFDFEPGFDCIKFTKGDENIIVDIKHVAKSNKEDKKQSFADEEQSQQLQANPELEVRATDLASEIEKHLKQQTSPLELLLSNNDLDKIKIGAAELGDEHAVELFKILKERVEFNPSESSVFNEWVKWLLLLYSNSINASVNLKSLKSSLSRNLKQLPDLLSLQGRLEMLQSQIKLRSQLSSVEEAQSNDRALIEQAEESIVYVNGENDEEDINDNLENADEAAEGGDEDNE